MTHVRDFPLCANCVRDIYRDSANEDLSMRADRKPARHHVTDSASHRHPFGGKERLTAGEHLAIVMGELFCGLNRKDVGIGLPDPLR